MWNLKYGTDEPIYKTETDQQTTGLRRSGIYTQWNTTQYQKEQNNAIYINMDGTRDSHTK